MDIELKLSEETVSRLINLLTDRVYEEMQIKNWYGIRMDELKKELEKQEDDRK